MALCREAVAALPQQVWVSFDIDGLDPSLCPGTGTPVPGGMTMPYPDLRHYSLRDYGNRVGIYRAFWRDLNTPSHPVCHWCSFVPGN